MTDSAAVARAERQLADVAGRTDAASLRCLHDQLDAVHVTESSPGGGVSVTVGPSGAVTALTISETAKADLTAPELSALLLSTMARAQAKLATAVAELTLSATGVDTGIAQALASTYAQRFPAVAPGPATAEPEAWKFTRELVLGPEIEERPPPRKPVVDGDSDDDYFRENPLR
jgi:hypothetical protein